ncbi:MAG: MFS transporter [Aliidongia sp.]
MPKDGAQDRVSSWHSSYVLLLVGLVSVANYYDRTLISILVEPIKRDLGLSDGQIGLLSGVGFAVMYSLLGVPMARLADRFGRVRVLGSVVAVWSVMTVLSGRTVSFTTMLLARAGVGIGEAGGLPAAHALIADYFSPRFRGKALSVIGVCGGLGLSLAYAGGGLINDWQGWRMAFYLGGLPGLVLSVLVFLTIREPKRSVGAGGAAPNVTFRQAAATLWRRKSYVLLCIGLGIGAIGSYGQSAWTPAFLMRAYHLSASEVGGYYSAVSGPATMVSILLGGLANDWLVARDKRWPLWLLALTFGLVRTIQPCLFPGARFRARHGHDHGDDRGRWPLGWPVLRPGAEFGRTAAPGRRRGGLHDDGQYRRAEPRALSDRAVQRPSDTEFRQRGADGQPLLGYLDLPGRRRLFPRGDADSNRRYRRGGRHLTG